MLQVPGDEVQSIKIARIVEGRPASDTPEVVGV